MAWLVGAPARAQESAAPPALSVQTGWWSIELQWRGRSGLFAGLGVPWVLYLYQDKWSVPYGGRLGYQHALTPNLGLRLSAHLAGAYGAAECCDGAGGPHFMSFRLLELGLRYEYPGGFVVGLDVPLYAASDRAGVEYLPPQSAALTQLYLGWSWRL